MEVVSLLSVHRYKAMLNTDIWCTVYTAEANDTGKVIPMSCFCQSWDINTEKQTTISEPMEIVRACNEISVRLWTWPVQTAPDKNINSKVWAKIWIETKELSL